MRWRRFTVLFAGLALCLAGVSGCGGESSPSDLSTQTLDEATARSSLTESGVTIPTEYTFVGGLNQPAGFPGSPDNYVRFDGPVETFAVARSLLDANPQFPAFHEVDCHLPLLARDERLARLGMTCTPATKVRLSQNTDSPNPEYVPGNTQALVLVAAARGTQLYVISAGT